MLACFDFPSYVGRSGDDERKVEQEERMKSQTYQRRLAFSGAFAGPQKESGHAATTKVEVQLLGSHAMQVDGVGAQLVHTVVYRLHGP